jgi:hypothetical protein
MSRVQIPSAAPSLLRFLARWCATVRDPREVVARPPHPRLTAHRARKCREVTLDVINGGIN